MQLWSATFVEIKYNFSKILVPQKLAILATVPPQFKAKLFQVIKLGQFLDRTTTKQNSHAKKNLFY